MIAVDCL